MNVLPAKIMKFILSRKTAAIAAALIIMGGGYYGYKYFFGDNNEVRYVLAQARKGTLIVSISGSGQVSVSNQIDVKPKAAGEVAYIGVKNGEEVKAGDLMVQLDARDAQKTVRDAETNLESAKIALEKLKKPADALSVLQAENALAKTKESKQKAEEELNKAYDDGFNAISNAFLDLPTMMVGLYGILFGNDFSASQENISYYADAVKNYDSKAVKYKDDAYSSYQSSKSAYDKNFGKYQSVTRYSDKAAIEALVNETYGTAKAVAETLKNANNLIQFYKDKLTEQDLKPDSKADTALSSLNAYTGKANTHLLNLLSAKNTIENEKIAITDAVRTIAEKTESLAKLKAGADELDIQSAELTLKQRENALLDAKEKLADYFIRALFDGIIASVDAKKGDNVSSASLIATLITSQKLAEISLNEIDAAKIKVGQKATLAFDAVPDVAITGQVAEIDAVGAVSQGVVTYEVKIIFDTQDERVKPGMSVSASITTEMKPHALLVPNSAVKSQGEIKYVEMPRADEIPAAGKNGIGIALKENLRRQTIETGLANDDFTEIISGLNEGDTVVSRTIQSNSSQAQSSPQQGIFRFPGQPGGGFRSGGTAR